MKGSGRGCGDAVQGRECGEIIKKFFFGVRLFSLSVVKIDLMSFTSILFFGCLPMPAWAVLEVSASFAKSRALLRCANLSSVRANTAFTEILYPS